ncbi:MAG: NAD-dependent epimerase/dehydratase family protein, partial [Magnetococcales bacterium]|nr:NAD-dependent epimerase/dehydratase family protein [Magnetococcales bacterium]
MVKPQDKRILVTGGLGYLGGRLSQHLAQTGAKIRIATRRTLDLFPHWADHFEMVTYDGTSDEDLDRLCEGVDVIIHLAAANEHRSAADPAGALMDTGVATVRLLQAAERQ